MAEADFWFLLVAASLSAAVIGWVCFLELSYRLERRRRRAFATGRAKLNTARATCEIVAPSPPTAFRSREQLRLLDRTPALKRKLSMHLPWWPFSKYVKQPSG